MFYVWLDYIDAIGLVLKFDDEKPDYENLVGVWDPDGPIGVACDHRFAIGVTPSAFVNLEGVTVIRPPLGVAEVEFPACSPDGVKSHLLLLGVSPI